MNPDRLVGWILALLVATGAQGAAGAVSPSAASLPPDMAVWESRLQQAGAGPAELAQFEMMVRTQSPADLSELQHYLSSTPLPQVLRAIRGIVRSEQEPTPAAIFPGIKPQRACADLRDVAIADTRIDSAAIGADGSCRIAAVVVHLPERNPIRVSVALPVGGWNGRFRGTGGGGYAGGSIRNLDIPVQHGYAAGATDTGNPEGTAAFALDDQGRPAWSRMRDNAYRGVHDMTVVGKALAFAFYGKSPRYSYFMEGSTGGRQGLTEAQRYPADYDGILALFPAIARDRYVPAQLWPQILMRDAHDFLPKAKLDAATAAAVKACGNQDGVIEDPPQCHYDAADLVGREIGGSTFTSVDAQLIEGMWEGPKGRDGHRLWWGPSRGTDLSNFADTGGSPLAGRPSGEGLDWFRYFLALDPKWDWTTLSRDDYELYFEQSIQVHSGIYGGDDPDLTAFRDHGGKLLIVHGWSDQFVPAEESVAYYGAVAKRSGGLKSAARFCRLFLVPGANHGMGNPVPTPSHDSMVEALLDWVEQSRPPNQLEAELRGDQGDVVRRTLQSYGAKMK